LLWFIGIDGINRTIGIFGRYWSKTGIEKQRTLYNTTTGENTGRI